MTLDFMKESSCKTWFKIWASYIYKTVEAKTLITEDMTLDFINQSSCKNRHCFQASYIYKSYEAYRQLWNMLK